MVMVLRELRRRDDDVDQILFRFLEMAGQNLSNSDGTALLCGTKPLPAASVAE